MPPFRHEGPEVTGTAEQGAGDAAGRFDAMFDAMLDAPTRWRRLLFPADGQILQIFSGNCGRNLRARAT